MGDGVCAASYERAEEEGEEMSNVNGWEHLKRYGYAPGDYMNRCHRCGAEVVMDKRAVICRSCAEALEQAEAEKVEGVRRTK